MTTRTALAVVWGERLKAARIEAGLTQAEVAKQVGQSQYTICRLEKGEHRPHDDTKYRLAEFFGTTVESLFPYTLEVAS